MQLALWNWTNLVAMSAWKPTTRQGGGKLASNSATDAGRSVETISRLRNSRSMTGEEGCNKLKACLLLVLLHNPPQSGCVCHHSLPIAAPTCSNLQSG